MVKMMADLMKEDICQRHLSKKRHVGKQSRWAGWKEASNRIVYDDLNPGLFTISWAVVKPQATLPRVLPPLDSVSLACANGL